MARKGAAAPSRLGTPPPPRQLGRISSYAGGRLSLSATAYVGSLGLLILWN